MEANLLRASYGREPDQEAGGEGFLWGAVDLPEDLLATVTFRSLLLNTEQPADGTRRWRYLQMMTDLRAQAKVGRVRINGSVGFVREGARAAAITSGEENNLVSREHWVGYELDEAGEWLVRAGRLNLPFGVRGVEHTWFVRAGTRTSINADQQHGAAIAHSGSGLRGELMAIAGNYQIHPDAFRERGYSGFLEFSLGESASVGASSLLTHAQRDQTLRVPTVRQAHGLFARVSPWHPLVLLAEGDVIVQMPEEASNRIGHATLLQADLEAWQGVHLMATAETFDSGVPSSDLSWAGWLSVDYFFLPHAEFRVDGIRQKMSLGPFSFTSNTLMGQFHFYL
jgi:hypothetical protein